MSPNRDLLKDKGTGKIRRKSKKEGKKTWPKPQPPGEGIRRGMKKVGSPCAIRNKKNKIHRISRWQG